MVESQSVVRRALLAVGLSLLLCPIIALADPPTERPARVSNLEALTRSARAHYPQLRAARHRITAARARLAEATISPFFQLAATASVTMAPEAHGTSIFSPDPQLPLSNPWRPVVQVGVEGAIPLYTFGKISAARDAARAGVRAAEQGELVDLAQLLYDVRRAYFSLQMALDVEQMIGEGEGRLERAAEQLDERIEEGSEEVNEQDRYRLASAIAEVQARRSEAQRLEDSARAALQILTDVPRIQVPDCPLRQVAYEPRPRAHYVRLASRNRPELAMLQAGIDAREANAQATRARYFPDLVLALSASHSYGPGITNQTNPFVVDRANYSSLGAALVARWSLDVWGNVHRVRRAEAELNETRELAEMARRGVELEVSSVYYELEDARRREEAWGNGHRQGRTWFVAAAQAYQVGALEPRELVDALKAYFTARFAHLQSIRDYDVAVANLERVSGEVLVAPGAWEERCEE